MGRSVLRAACCVPCHPATRSPCLPLLPLSALVIGHWPLIIAVQNNSQRGVGEGWMHGYGAEQMWAEKPPPKLCREPDRSRSGEGDSLPQISLMGTDDCDNDRPAREPGTCSRAGLSLSQHFFWIGTEYKGGMVPHS